MITYEEYQNRTIVNIEAMRETRRQQGEELQLLQAEINARMADAKRRYLEEQSSLFEIQRDKAKAISDKWKAERMRLYLEHARVVEQWREEHGITPPPPFVEGSTRKEVSHE